MRTVSSPAHMWWCALNGRNNCEMALSSSEEKSEATGSLLDPTMEEFTPVWPLPPAPHLRSAALKPLLFPEPTKEDKSHLLRRSRDLPLPCVLCDRCFGEGGEEEEEEGRWERVRDALLRHFLEDHCIVIHQVENIASLRSYCQYWRERLTPSNISTYCPVIRTNTQHTDPGPSRDYYLMSDALPEDRQLRESLQLARLEAVLEQQQFERQDTEFKRSCLFCGLVVVGNRGPLLQHMRESHGFSIGRPDNLVFVSEFLDLLQRNLDKLLCLYCEKKFKDRNTLKEHMRKKQHKKINPNNTEYDRFYVVNYQEAGRGWREIMAEDAEEATPLGDEGVGWGDWNEDTEPHLHCLFCLSFTSPSLPALACHMKEVHRFNWEESIGCHDYYRQVKAVNYLRRQVARQHCPVCHSHCSSEPQLMQHLDVEGHYSLPTDMSTWDQAQFLFPTFENDALLCCLDDDNAD